MDQQLLSLEAAADFLKVGVTTIQSLIDRDLLVTEGDPPHIRYATLVDFLRQDQQRLEQGGGQPADLGILPTGKAQNG